MSEARFRYPPWVRGDLDGFFGLMVDNLVQVLTIIALCSLVCGVPGSVITTRILPGVAVSLLIGNLFYGLQAHYIARKFGRPNTTALPYGINTPSVFAFVLFVMAPVYHGFRGDLGDEAAADLAWKAGMLACLVSGVIEFLGASVAEYLRRVTPRAALLGVFVRPCNCVHRVLISRFAFTRSRLSVCCHWRFCSWRILGRYRFPFGLPGGLVVVGVGTAIAWGTTAVGWDSFGGVRMSGDAVRGAIDNVRWMPPIFCGPEIMSVLSRPGLLIPFLTVSIPMGVINILGSLQNIESAEARR